MITGLTAGLLFMGAAAANPVSTETLSVQQVAGTQHVQVTWGSVDKVHKPNVTRDGEELSVSWVSMDEDFMGNTGSGLTELDAVQFCDCKVELGAHDYVAQGYTARMEVVEGYTGPEENTDTGAPWNVTVPAGQGLDCVDTCGDSVEPMPAVACSSSATWAAWGLILLPLLGLPRRRR